MDIDSSIFPSRQLEFSKFQEAVKTFIKETRQMSLENLRYDEERNQIIYSLYTCTEYGMRNPTREIIWVEPEYLTYYVYEVLQNYDYRFLSKRKLHLYFNSTVYPMLCINIVWNKSNQSTDG